MTVHDKEFAGKAACTLYTPGTPQFDELTGCIVNGNAALLRVRPDDRGW
jgi:hypothetical protein